MRRHAEIAGAGFAGLCAGLALLQRGWSVRLHERAPSLRSEGFGIAIHENGIRVLEALGVLDAVLERALRISRLESRERAGRTASVHVPRSRTYHISRQHMVQVLAEAVRHGGGEVRTGSAATAATADGTLRPEGGAPLRAEPRRVCRRLQPLRRWSDDGEEDGGELLARGSGAGVAAGARRRW